MNAYVNVSAMTHYVNVSSVRAVSSYVNSTAYAQFMRGVDARRRLDEELAHYNASGYTALLAQKLRHNTMGARAPSGTRRIRSASSAVTNASLSAATAAGENATGPTTEPASGAAARCSDGEPLASEGGGGGSQGRGGAATWWGQVVRQGVLADVVSGSRGWSFGLTSSCRNLSLGWSKRASGGQWRRGLRRVGQEWRRGRTGSTAPSARCWTCLGYAWWMGLGVCAHGVQNVLCIVTYTSACVCPGRTIYEYTSYI